MVLSKFGSSLFPEVYFQGLLLLVSGRVPLVNSSFTKLESHQDTPGKIETYGKNTSHSRYPTGSIHAKIEGFCSEDLGSREKMSHLGWMKSLFSWAVGKIVSLHC